MNRPAITAVLIFTAACIILMLLHPEASLQAALKGISIWWEILFPALLPFLVLSEIMLGFGIVHFIGTFLDPLMRPLFRVQGTGGFVMAMGFASGYPMAAKLVAELRSRRLISRDEGERLVSFCTTADPIFLIGAVSVGFFHDPRLAPILIAAHYGAAVLVGFIIRFHGSFLPADVPSTIKRERSLLRSALSAMHQARLADPTPFGKLLKRAVEGALEIILLLGGLVVFISVVLELLRVSGAMHILYVMMDYILTIFHLPLTMTKTLMDGIFEVTLGVKAAADASTGLFLQLIMACFIISWGGLSVHAQIIGLLNKTDLRYRPFLFARFIHGLLSSMLALLIWHYFVI